MACADVATAKAKAATAINLIIVFSHVLVSTAKRADSAVAHIIRDAGHTKDFNVTSQEKTLHVCMLRAVPEYRWGSQWPSRVIRPVCLP